ncbi:protein of unknown function (plasmid) [Azospirillum lipoferum 4B]|uniref:Uncharacterized protein n=1 Tax=Azospirillum lipoferum (strain 4B) TaxID=862719 RepID=G7ZHL1_AZOL4|nr:protein of unknown function [Azospirillum lipoferum 4B]
MWPESSLTPAATFSGTQICRKRNLKNVLSPGAGIENRVVAASSAGRRYVPTFVGGGPSAIVRFDRRTRSRP